MSDKKIFEEAVNGYGFEEVEQRPDGLYCNACNTIHKRPTKMYKTRCAPKELFCKYGIIRFWNPLKD